MTATVEKLFEYLKNISKENKFLLDIKIFSDKEKIRYITRLKQPKNAENI